MIMIQAARPLSIRSLCDRPAPQFARTDCLVDAPLRGMYPGVRVPVEQYEWQAVAASVPLFPSLQGSTHE
jgi:hypothetical protein